MSNLNHLIYRILFAFSIACAYLFLGSSYVYAKTFMVTAQDSIVITPLQKFDFGTPTPNADKSQIKERIDYLRVASTEEILSSMMETTSLNAAATYAPMATADENIEYAVGQIPYQENVSPYGGRIYSIPIMVSEMSDFSPQISLLYNSQSGNGVAGYGWTIGGLSSITISNKSLYYNSVTASAHVNDYDAVYSLDGNPLVQNDDPNSASEYQLKTAKGHILVKKHLSSNNNVSYFTALYPDGSKATFGFTSSVAPRAAFPMTLWEDKLGNIITYNYDHISPNYIVSSIQFRHKNNSSDIGRIDFNYSSRTDYHTYYYAGEATYQNNILKSITSISGGATLCTYSLTHELKDGVNMLTSIGCSNSVGEQLRPLCFAYGSIYDYGGSTTKDLERIERMFLSTYFTNSGDFNFQYIRGKMLASNFKDGLVIIPYISNYNIIESKLQWFTRRYKYGSIYAADQDILVAHSLMSNSNAFIIKTGSEFQYINAADIDGDGVDEIIKVNFNGINANTSTTTLNITIYRATASGVNVVKSFNIGVRGIFSDNGVYESPVQRCYMLGDFRGDGKTQLLTISFSSNEFYTTNESYAALIDLDTNSKILEQPLFLLSSGEYDNQKVICQDIDGDGKTEICRLSGNDLEIYNLGTEGFTLTRTISTVSTLLSQNTHITDVNKDGYIDFAVEPSDASSPWIIYKYHGQDFASEVVYLNGKSEGDKFLFIDINKDSFADLIQRNQTTTYIYLNENGTFNSANRITSSLLLDANTEFVPSNIMEYDRMSDFITIEESDVNIYGFTQNLGEDRLLTKFTNSLGAVTVNNYADMAASDVVYQIDETRTYSNTNGFAKGRFPLQLLLSSQNYLSSSLIGESMLTNVYYTYFDACINTKGLGFCGFGTVRTTNFRTVNNKEIVTIETRDPEKMQVVTKLAYGLRMTQDTPYDITTYVYDSHSTTYGKLNPRLKKVNQNNTLTGLKSTTTYSYGLYDFPTSISITRSGGRGGKLEESQEVEYSHNTSLSNYCLGMVLSDTRIHTIPEKYVINDTIYDGGPLSESDLPLIFVPIDTTLLYPNIDTLPSSHWVKRQVYAYGDNMMPASKIDYTGPSILELNKVNEVRWTYDSYGNILTEDSAPYNVTDFIGKSYVYDSDGVTLQAMTDEFGHTTSFLDYNKFGKPQRVRDYVNRITVYQYDDWGKLLTYSTPDGTESSTSEEWGGLGAYTVTTSVSGKPSEIVHYDAAGRELRRGSQRFDECWIFVDKIYNISGKIQKESLPFKDSGNATKWSMFEYDEYLRPTSYRHPSGQTTAWRYEGNVTIEIKSGLGSAKTVNSNGQTTMIQDNGGTIDYTLRADGKPSKVTVTGGYSILFEYDNYGRRVAIIDPSAGVQTDNIVYEADGSSIATHTNPNGSVITYSDKYGRTIRVERPGEYTTNYLYNQRGLLVSEVSSNGTSKEYTYDNYDRVSTMREIVPDGMWLKKTFLYDLGNIVRAINYQSQSGTIASETFTYANGTRVLSRVLNTPILQLKAENEFGKPTAVQTGNVIRNYYYNSYGMQVGRKMGSVMHCSYEFDGFTGNLATRYDNIRNNGEVFYYDELNRLVMINEREITYSDNGNITHIDAVGEMLYGKSDKPYQITTLILDDNVVPSRVQDVAYTCYSRPSILTEGGRSAAFTYNGDGERVKMNISEGATSVLARYYIGNQYEVDVTPSGTTERLYLGGDAYSAPMVYIKQNRGPWTFYNIGRDYLGNITHITTANGVLVEENSYDPWGRLRDPETLEIYSPGTEPELMLGRGYTGHEHLTWFGLINMNARLYDPLLGRFLSPDPFVQMPDFTQNFNRYSYCLNNPLVYLDQNGEFIFTLSTFAIIGICTSAAIGVGLGVYEGYKIAERKGLEGSARVWTMIGGGLIGGVAGGASAFVGAYVGAGMVAAEIGGFYAGAITGGAAGATAGFINGFGMGTLETGNPLSGLNQGFYQGTIGGLSGALMGGLIQGTSSAIKGNNFWDGSAPNTWDGSAPNTWDGSAPNTKNYSTNFDSHTELSNGNDGYSVYEGRDPSTLETKYVGITKRDPKIRIGEHLNSKTPRAALRYNVIDYGLTKQEARVMEQLFINKYGLENLYNKINSIAPKFWSSYNIY